MLVPQTTPHIPSIGGDAVVSKDLVFPPDVEEFIYDLIATALLRAVENGTYVPPNSPLDVEQDD